MIEADTGRTYATVYRAFYRVGNVVVALKVLKKDPELGIQSTAVREIAILAGLAHPNIVMLFDHFQLENHLILAIELFALDLRQYIQKFSTSIRSNKFIMYQLLDALIYLHQHPCKITHRDVTRGNIFLNLNLHVKISVWYRAPELLLGKPSNSAFNVDFWAAGCVMGELYSREPLFPGDNCTTVLEMIARKMGIINAKIWPEIFSLPSYQKYNYLARFSAEDIIDSLPAVTDDSGKDLLRLLLKRPIQKRDSCFLDHYWFDGTGFWENSQVN